jgi:predicted AAA+ superfamily ATPase
MDSFYQTHQYLLQHVHSPVRRGLMDEINWNERLIGIKGSRGVGKTTFLLSYAKEFFGTDNRECLYINMNHFLFTDRTLIDFAGEFRARGGKVLLIDQVFKYPNWSEELSYCYDNYKDLRIVFTGSSVMRLNEENPDLYGKVAPYLLRGFSFREYLNLATDNHFPSYRFNELIENHEAIAQDICAKTKPRAYFQDYLNHGFYPFFLEKRNFSENLLKTMNMTLEVDVMYIRQIEQRYLPKLRKLLYLMSLNLPCSPNVSQLSKAIETSRATVMNYIHYLREARLISLLYDTGEDCSKKPSKVYMYNSNLIYAVNQARTDELAVYETFFCNQLLKDNTVNTGEKNVQFIINGSYPFQITTDRNVKDASEIFYAVEKLETGNERQIPLWLFGFLY